MKTPIFLICLCALIMGCSEGDDPAAFVPVDATVIGTGNLFGNGAEGISEQNLVISTTEAWNDLLTQMNSVNNVTDSFTETTIDFTQYRVIAVFDEIRGNGGFRIDLDIWSANNQIVVQVTDLAPQGNATTVITQPFHVVKIALSDLPVVFQ